VRLPAADDLFRPTGEAPEVDAARDGHRDERRVRAVPPADDTRSRRPSGRVRHDEKMTVYVTADELLDIEHARLTLRRAGLSVDRGRLVREAVALALADLDERGDGSAIVQRLMQA
jgi:hypothetical protein